MDILIKLFQFFLCFTILVGIHELGHFLTARLFRIRVEKFYIFFDPWFSLFKFKRGHTEYGLGWLPMGGYVKIAGMIDESMDKEFLNRQVESWEFRAKPAWQRFLVMIAGVVMNVVLAVSIYIGICYTWGDTYFANDDAHWGYNFNAAGKQLGFKDGDQILSIDGTRYQDVSGIVNALLLTEGARTVEVLRNGESQHFTIPFEKLVEMRQQKGYEKLMTLRMPFIIDSVVNPSAAVLLAGDEIVGIDSLLAGDFKSYQQYIRSKAGHEVSLHVLRNNEQLLLTLPVSTEGQLGVLTRNPYHVRTRTYTFLEAIPAGIRKTGNIIASYWDQLKLIVQPKTKMYEELGGFIAIGNIFPSEWNWQDFWMKTAFLSIILAVMNILPIPGLDGGHALFTFWEMITRRKLSDRFLEIAQYIGLSLLLFLLIYANGNDIYRFFIK